MVVVRSKLMHITTKPLANALLKIIFPDLQTLILIYVVILLNKINAFSDVDNEIVGSPLVECERDRIRFSVPTKRPFRGKVYVKGEFTNEDCVRVYADDNDDQNWPTDENISKLKGTFNGEDDQIHSSRNANNRKEKKRKGANTKLGTPDVNGECPLVCPPCEKPLTERRRRTAIRVYDYADLRSADGKDEDGNPKSSYAAELDVLLGTCNTRRDRMANPPGVHVSFTVVVNFHNNFITKIDKAYRVECAYEESDRTVTTQINVSAPQSIDLSGVVEPPQCHYSITTASSNVDNPLISNRTPLKNVRVGDSIRHEWICMRNSMPSIGDTRPLDEGLSQAFGLLVHDCYVDDGRGRREPVIDEKGCSISPLILPTPLYDNDIMMASVDSLVAKFPDRDLLGFQCAITVCMRDGGNCDDVTPPVCDQRSENRTKRSTSNTASVSEWQLNAPVLTVFDAVDDHIDEFRSLLSLARSDAHDIAETKTSTRLDFEELCVSVVTFGILVSASTFIVTISSTIIFTVLFLHVQWHSTRELTKFLPKPLS